MPKNSRRPWPGTTLKRPSSLLLPRTPNCIYKISCTDCPDFHIGQTYRPISLRIKEHKAAYRLNNIYDSATGNIKSAPAKHAHGNQHLVDFNSVQVLTTASNRHCLNLLEHAAIVTLDRLVLE